MNTNEEMEDINYNSKKIEAVSRKEGLREGISAGRENNFQESFNAGYKDGFKNGFILGQYKGYLCAKSKQESESNILPPLLEHVSNGSCEVCKSTSKGDLEDKGDINAINQIQNKILERNMQILESSYKTVNIEKIT